MDKTKRTEQEKKNLKNRISRIAGQLNGISKMVDDDRYTNDILIQLSAVSSAAKSIANILIEQHLRSSVLSDLKKGKEEVVEEVVDIFKRF